MAEITAASVKELRERTGAGMMDCKKALAANNGEMEASIDRLRAKGLAAAAQTAATRPPPGTRGEGHPPLAGRPRRGRPAAAKRPGRPAAEGLVGVAVEGSR